MIALKQFRIVYLLRKTDQVVATQKETTVKAATADQAVELFNSTTPWGYEQHVQYWEEVK